MLEAGCAGLADSRLPSLEQLAAHASARSPSSARRSATSSRRRRSRRPRPALATPGAARALGEHAAGAPVEVLLTVDLGDRREGVLAGRRPAARRRSRRPARRRARRHQRQLRLPLRAAALAGAVPPGRGRPRVVRRPAAPPSRCSPRRHLRPAAPRRLPARASPPRSAPAAGRSTATTSSARRRIGRAGAHRPGAHRRVLECLPQAAGAGGPGGLDAFGHVPDVDLPAEDAWYALLRPRAPRRGAARPAAAHRPVPTSPARQRRQRPHHASRALRPGDTVAFAVDYDALVRAVTSPFVDRRVRARGRRSCAGHRAGRPEGDA